MESLPAWAPGEERVNMWSHAIGIPISITATIVFAVQAIRAKDMRKLFANMVFSAMLIIMYTNSTLYHGVSDPEMKKIFRYVDHISIYLLIAGSYTPFMFSLMRGKMANTIMAIVWSIAIVGTALKIYNFDGFVKFSLFLYIAMGWIVMIPIKQLLKVLPKKGFYWLLLGGLSYTGGTYFFAQDESVTYAHAIWHIFVLLGSVSHIVCVYKYT